MSEKAKTSTRKNSDYHPEVLKLIKQRRNELGRALEPDEVSEIDQDWAAQKLLPQSKKLRKEKRLTTDEAEQLMQEPPLGGVVRSDTNEYLRGQQFKELEEATPEVVSKRINSDPGHSPRALVTSGHWEQ